MATSISFNPFENLSAVVDIVGRRGFNDPIYSLIIDAEMSGLDQNFQLRVNTTPTPNKINGVEFNATANRIDWHDYVAPSPVATLSANVLVGDGTINITDANFMARPGNTEHRPLLRITNPVTGLDEDLLVTAGFGTTALTVTRAQNSTTAAAYTAGQKVMYVPEASENLGMNTLDNSVVPTPNYNHYTPLYEPLQGTIFQDNRDAPGDFSKMTTQEREAMRRVLSRLSSAAYKGVRRPSTNASAVVREAGGLKFFSTKRTAATTFNETFMKDRIVELADMSVTDQVFIGVSDTLYNTVNAMKTVRVTGGGMPTDSEELKLTFDQFKVGNLTGNIFRSQFLDNGECVFFDPSRFAMFYTAGGKPRMNRDEATGGFQKRSAIVGEFTFCARNGALGGLWYTQCS